MSHDFKLRVCHITEFHANFYLRIEEKTSGTGLIYYPDIKQRKLKQTNNKQKIKTITYLEKAIEVKFCCLCM